MQREEWLKTDLKKPIKVQELKTDLFLNDETGNKIGVEVLDDGMPYSVSGDVKCYMIRPDTTTLIIDGTVSENKVIVILPKQAYYYTGRASFVIKVESEGNKTTVCAFSALVYRDRTDRISDDERVIPSLEEIMAIVDQINNMTASATTLPAGSQATASMRTVDGHYHIDMGIPKGEAGSVSVKNATAAAANWSAETPSTITISVTGVTANNSIVVSLASSLTAEQYAAAADAQIMCTAQATNSITLTAFGTVPEVDIPITVMIFG